MSFTYLCLLVCMSNDGKPTFLEFVQVCEQAVAALGFQVPAHFDLSDLKLAHIMPCFNLNGKLVEVFYLVVCFFFFLIYLLSRIKVY